MVYQLSFVINARATNSSVTIEPKVRMNTSNMCIIMKEKVIEQLKLESQISTLAIKQQWIIHHNRQNPVWCYYYW